MKDEIKKILDKLKDGNWYNELDLTGEMWIELRWEETHLLLDYITNLQQELEEEKRIEEADLKTIQRLEEEKERLKELCNKYEEEHNTTFKEWQKDIRANRKAIEYINKNKKVVSKYEAKDTRLPLDTFMWGVDNLLNILQNGSEEK